MGERVSWKIGYRPGNQRLCRAAKARQGHVEGWEREEQCPARLLFPREPRTKRHSESIGSLPAAGSGPLHNFPPTRQGPAHSGRLKLVSLAELEASLSQATCLALRTRESDKACSFHTVTLLCQRDRYYPFSFGPHAERRRMMGLLRTPYLGVKLSAELCLNSRSMISALLWRQFHFKSWIRPQFPSEAIKTQQGQPVGYPLLSLQDGQMRAEATCWL